MAKKGVEKEEEKIPWGYWVVWSLSVIAIALLVFQIIRTLLA